MDGELRRLRESHSEATVEATHFRNLHVKGIMEYSRRKANFAKELEECKKSASDRIWAQAARMRPQGGTVSHEGDDRPAGRKFVPALGPGRR